MTTEQIINIFTYHEPFGGQPQRYQYIRDKALILAETIQALCPMSREKSRAITNLQQAVMWAHASIAVNENPGKGAFAEPPGEEGYAGHCY